VTLSFNKMNERLHIPFAAVTAFADPSAKFGLQFQADASIELESPYAAEQPEEEAAEAQSPPKEAVLHDPEQGAQVIALDAFRKK
jgi:hypothetical protein